jgi:hypothetical protein
MGIAPITPNNWSLLVIDRNDLYLPKGWITAIVPIEHEFSDYERTSGIWKIIDVPDRPYPIPELSGIVDSDGISIVTAPDSLFMIENGNLVEKTETTQEIIDIQALKKPEPLAIPDHLDRSQSVIWDYGPGRTYSTPQAAYDALYTSIGVSNFTQTHYIRGWSGTYGLTGSYVLYFNPAVVPGSRTNILVCDAEAGETVIWDGQGAAAILFGNSVEHVTIEGIKLGNATYGIYPVTWNANVAVEDWEIHNCEGDGTIGPTGSPFACYGITDLLICDCYCHDLAATGAGALVGRKPNRTESFDVKFGNNRFQGDYGIFMASPYTTCIFGNTIKASVECLADKMGIKGSLGFIVDNIFYGESGSACDCINADTINSWQMMWLNADGNCYYPGDSGGSVMVLANTIYTTLAQLQAGLGKDVHSIESDPLLNSDLSIPAGSPCVTAGVCTPYDGYNRVIRGALSVDIGAFQYTDSAPTPANLFPPTFDGLENDGDGDAVTLTITPPATGSYTKTQIYYRILGSGSAWVESSTYVGIQGVQGTKQITGLDNGTYYEFILAANYENVYSSPTRTRSIYCTDNTDNGDYINVETQAVATLQADTGSGGLNETGDPMVQLFERGVRDAPNQYAKQDMPAIGVYCTTKREIQDQNEETVEKDFEVLFVIVTRAGDIPEGEDICKKIMARLETVIREQTSTANLWSQLPTSDLIKGAEGTLASIVMESTAPIVHDQEEVSQGDFIIYAMVKAEIQIPVSFDL